MELAVVVQRKIWMTFELSTNDGVPSNLLLDGVKLFIVEFKNIKSLYSTNPVVDTINRFAN